MRGASRPARACASDASSTTRSAASIARLHRARAPAPLPSPLLLQAMPPAALTFGLASCVFLHAYDRILKPRGLMQENMPTTHLHRRSM